MNVIALKTQQRIQSIDILRGLVMLVMALDHVRDFFHANAFLDDPTNLATTTPYLFFTRWITHLCAPTFVFLSGMSAYLAGSKRSKKQLSSFLISRGSWLILVEVLIITFALTFNPLYNIIVLQVIWAIGVSMIVLGLLVRTSVSVILIAGLIIFFGHNLFDYSPLPQNAFGAVASYLVTISHKIIPLGYNHFLFIFYAAIPWAGVMLLGYAFAHYCSKKVSAESRAKVFFVTGFITTLFFIVVRFINAYGDPSQWSFQKNFLFTAMSFLNTTKYPCSLLYLTMTLGPALMLLALFQRMQNSFTNILQVYGRVPFFYYVVHFYLIHALCVIVFFANGYTTAQIADPQTPFLFRPQHFGFPLWGVYLTWLFIIIILYWPCKWFNRYKAINNQWWLSYV